MGFVLIAGESQSEIVCRVRFGLEFKCSCANICDPRKHGSPKRRKGRSGSKKATRISLTVSNMLSHLPPQLFFTSFGVRNRIRSGTRRLNFLGRQDKS